MEYLFAIGLFNINIEQAPNGYECTLTFGNRTLMTTDVYRSKHDAKVAILERVIRMSQNNILEAEKMLQAIKQEYTDGMNGKW
jgi:hypothetical protein